MGYQRPQRDPTACVAALSIARRYNMDMHACRIHTFGGPDVLRDDVISVPAPRAMRFWSGLRLQV